MHQVTAMNDTPEPLILDLLEWIGPESRPYEEVMDAWRTSCPQLTVWEEANARGLIEHYHDPIGGNRVAVSARGREYLDERRPRRAKVGAVE